MKPAAIHVMTMSLLHVMLDAVVQEFYAGVSTGKG
jgi:hypothetical protein